MFNTKQLQFIEDEMWNMKTEYPKITKEQEKLQNEIIQICKSNILIKQRAEKKDISDTSPEELRKIKDILWREEAFKEKIGEELVYAILEIPEVVPGTINVDNIRNFLFNSLFIYIDNVILFHTTKRYIAFRTKKAFLPV